MCFISSTDSKLQSSYIVYNYNYSEKSKNNIKPEFITLFILIILLIISFIYDWMIREKSTVAHNENNSNNIEQSNIYIIVAAFLLPIIGIVVNCYIIPFLILKNPPEMLDIMFLGFSFVLHTMLSLYIHKMFIISYDKTPMGIIIGSIVAILFFLSLVIPNTHPIILLCVGIFINFMGFYIIFIYSKESLLDNNIINMNNALKILLFIFLITIQTFTGQPLREYIDIIRVNKDITHENKNTPHDVNKASN